MWKKLSLLLVGIAFSSNLFGIGIIEKNNSMTWYDNGMYLYQKGEYLKSVECFEKALSIYPGNQKARDMMEKVVKMAMNGLKKRRGVKQGGSANSSSSSSGVRNVPPRREIVYDAANSFHLARDYMRSVETHLRGDLGKIDNHFQHLNKYLKNARGSEENEKKIAEQLQMAKADELNKEGLKYAKEGKFQKAIELFQKAIQQNPYNVQAHVNLGLAYAYSDRLYDAIKEYKMVLKLADKNSREYKIAKNMIEKLKGFI